MTQFITDTERLAARAATIALALRVTAGRLRACGPCSDALLDLREAEAALEELIQDMTGIVEVNE